MLELKKIKKSYKVGENTQEVLKGIDIKFRRNEFTSILGSSGSGKTTLLNIIGGLDKYDSGDLIIEGTSTKQYKDRDWDSYRNHRVGFIFQSYNLIMHQSVLQNVEIALTLSGVSKEERKNRAKEALKKVGLEDHINKVPSQLSGGQMQRVAIARALVNDPEIILADEPTGALDSKTSIQIMDLLKEIAKDKLVIMVTHNPEIAKEYSTRIIELKDGLIINDSKPFDGKEKEEKDNKKITRTSMSLMTALSLSFNNLLTKKGRTFLTAFAGSIGIIGIALILSLSNGVNNYAHSLERDAVSDNPMTIERKSIDLFGSISESLNDSLDTKKCEDGNICSKDDVVKQYVISTENGMVKRNNIKEFMAYANSKDEFKKNVEKVDYSYAFELQVYTNDGNKVNPTDINPSGTETNFFNELPTNMEKAKVLAGAMPSNKNEVVLVLNTNHFIKDSILYSLNIKDSKVLQEEVDKIKKDNKYRVGSKSYKYEDFLNKTFKVIKNTDKYKEEKGLFIDYSNDSNYMKQKVNSGTEIKIVGVVELESAVEAYIGYTHELTTYLIEEVAKTNIYRKQIENKNVNVLTGVEFDDIITSYEDIATDLGIYELNDPSSISIYPKDYNSKKKLEDFINKYNEEKKAEKRDDLVINYTDMIQSLISGVTKVINIISFVLIGFIAISLLVSSIMIAIITYISVLERTKEIGILRAIGASKKDIKRVFRAETIIEGLIAGLLGVIIAFLLGMFINAIVSVFAKDIGNIASMPLVGAVLLILLSIGLNVIAGLKPASMAAKKDPVEALRTE